MTIYRLGPMTYSDARGLVDKLTKEGLSWDFLAEDSDADFDHPQRGDNASLYPGALDSYNPQQKVVIEVVTNEVSRLNRLIEPFGYPPFETEENEVSAMESNDRPFQTQQEEMTVEKYQISKNPFETENQEEFVCPKGDFFAPSLRLCPRHGMKLIPFSEYVEKQRLLKQRIMMVISVLALIAYGIVSYVKYIKQ